MLALTRSFVLSEMAGHQRRVVFMQHRNPVALSDVDDWNARLSTYESSEGGSNVAV
jgi:hypothetical protein